MSDAAEVDDGPVRFMQQVVSLTYQQRTSPVQRRFDELAAEGRLVGQRCPECSRVYFPPKGFCPMCVVETTSENEVELADRGTVANFTILTPIQYRGQEEKDPYALASILLDGADSTVGQQRLAGIPLDEIRPGLRVAAVWREPDDRGGDGGGVSGGVGNVIGRWEPTGEPDAPKAAYQEHIL